MLGSLIIYLKGMRLLMFQLSGFYCTKKQQVELEPSSKRNSDLLVPSRSQCELFGSAWCELLRGVCYTLHYCTYLRVLAFSDPHMKVWVWIFGLQSTSPRPSN